MFKLDFINNVHWLIFYSVIILSWFLLFILGANYQVTEKSIGILDSEFWASICRPNANLSDFPKFFLMWALMSLGMMLPTIIPTLRTYDDLIKGKIGNSAGFYKMVMGFCCVWILFSSFASVLQMLLIYLNLINFDGILFNPIFSGIVLLLAGMYQFSSLKEACLSKCRSPITFFLEYGSQVHKYEFSLGLRIGAYCLGCCWLLMLLAFIGGTMNLFFMAVAMLLMTFEKLPDIGIYVTKPIAFSLIILSFIYFLSPLRMYV